VVQIKKYIDFYIKSRTSIPSGGGGVIGTDFR